MWCPGHFAGEDVKAKLAELHGRWDTLKAKASQRRQDLEDSLQAQQYFADANEAESWMREKEPIVGSTDYGKDEDSAEVQILQQKNIQWCEKVCLIFKYVLKHLNVANIQRNRKSGREQTLFTPL